MDQGLLVPDELVIEMLLDRLSSLGQGQGLVLDGFPRTVPQAQALDRALADRGRSIDMCVHITAPDDVLMERMIGRAKESTDVRSDDTPEAMRTRLAGMKPSPELLAHYRDTGKLKDVDGTPDVPTVTRSVIAALGVQAEAR
jgi:adenylate kinase